MHTRTRRVQKAVSQRTPKSRYNARARAERSREVAAAGSGGPGGNANHGVPELECSEYISSRARHELQPRASVASGQVHECTSQTGHGERAPNGALRWRCPPRALIREDESYTGRAGQPT